jgi:L-arabinose transport system substrate-binding protein
MLVVVSLFLQACGPAAAPAPQAQAPAQAEPTKAAQAEPTQAPTVEAPAATQAPTETAPAKPAASTKKFNVAYIVKMGDNPWFVTEANGLKKVAGEKGVNLTIQDVKLDATLAMDAVDQAIGTGVDGIITVVPDQKIGPAVLKKAAAAKIPVVSIDDYIYDDANKQAPFVGFFAPDIGKQVGDKAAELFKAADWQKDPKAVIRAVSIELPTLSVCQMRTDASTKTWLATFPNMKDNTDILHLPYDGTLKGAADVFPAFITAHPEITHWVLWSCNDDGVLGAVRALENAGVKADNIIGVGLGAHMACDEWNKAKPTGFKAAVYINAALHGQKAMEIMYDYLANGTPLPENSIVKGVMVDPTNYKGTIDGCK